jgi:TRAP-type C4-dicarboxylate transport system permease small subunit
VILAQTTPALPDNTGYVAAAYLVFFALVLIYVVIMASKLARFERELTELNDLADERARARSAAVESEPAPEEAGRR